MSRAWLGNAVAATGVGMTPVWAARQECESSPRSCSRKIHDMYGIPRRSRRADSVMEPPHWAQVRSIVGHLSCDNHGMGNEAGAAGNRVGLAIAHARGPVILVGVALAFVGGSGVGVFTTAGSGDPAVQGALVGAVAGVAGGFVGAAIGAWASRDTANRTIADAQQARNEARQDATAGMFLQERRAAVVAVLAIGEAAVREAERTALNAKADSRVPRTDLLDDFRLAWLELILLAPDLTSGDGGAYSGAAARAATAFATWTSERIADLKAGHELEPMPGHVSEAVTALDDARATFLVEAMKHLGVPSYAQPDIRVLLGNWPNPE